MKIFIDFAKSKIEKVTPAPIYFGNNNVDKITLYFKNMPDGVVWYPTLSALCSDNNPIYPRLFDTDGTGTKTIDNINYTYYEFTLSNSNGWNLTPGRTLFYAWINYPNTNNANKCVGSFGCTILETSGFYQIDNPFVNPELRAYLDTSFQLQYNEIDEKFNSLEEEFNDEYTEEVNAQRNLINNLIGGEPRYVNTSSNILALTSNHGVAVGTDTGHWYAWDGTQYVDGGVYQAAEDSDTVNKLVEEVDDLSIFANNIIIDGGFDENPVGKWSRIANNFSLDNGTLKCTITQASANCGIYQYHSELLANNKYYVRADFLTKYNRNIKISMARLKVEKTAVANEWTTISGIITPVTFNNYNIEFYHDVLEDYSIGDYFNIDNIMVVNLTEVYGAGNEPSAEDFENVLALNFDNKWFDGIGNILNGKALANEVKRLKDIVSNIDIEDINYRLTNIENVLQSFDLLPPKPVIFDTDWFGDCDDVVAARILCWAERNNLIDIVALCESYRKPLAVASLDAFMGTEGRRGLVIGTNKSRNLDTGAFGTWQNNLLQYYHSYSDTTEDAPSSLEVYRRALSGLENKCDIIVTGPLVNISVLLQSQADSISNKTGMELVTEKVNKIWVMGGKYPSGSEANFVASGNSPYHSKYVCDNCPVPIIFLGWEVGNSVLSGNTLKNVSPRTFDPLAQVLYDHNATTYENGRSSWDPMITLLACMDNFDLCGYNKVYGHNEVNETTGANLWVNDSNGKDCYVTKIYTDLWYQRQLNTIIERYAWSSRKMGGQQLLKWND